MLEVRDLGKNFDGFWALSKVDLTVEKGARHAVIGPNGAGKSTLFNAITGYLKPTTGSVTLDGRDITGAAPDRLVRGGMGRSFQRVNVFPELTAFENVQSALLAHHRRLWDFFTPGDSLYRDEAQALLAQVGLAEDAPRVAGTLAYGKQKQLELALSLASEPKVLLLDEPTAGMSPQETMDILALIKRLQEERGLTLLFTEHDMEFVFAIATRMTVLVQGTPIAHGTPEEVRNSEEVQRVYLGGEHAA
ncbi:ABC transporter ATP-binding protein [Marivita sp. S0852]|uniref:ABC transporter ATP-binding protein n=1 Tax=Marivita sp. S0852 TaxID=3373893 RepID=UPI003982182F